MQTQRRVWNILQQQSIVGFTVGLSLVAAFGLSFMVSGANTAEARAASICSPLDPSFVSVTQQCRETLLGTHDKLKVLQGRVPSHTTEKQKGKGEPAPTAKASTAAPPPAAQAAPKSVAAGSANVFPYGECTWWADERYHQLHGIYVPWKTNASAMNWARLASQFSWRVSNKPTVGSIIVLQPGVQGAYSAGHVGIVERVLGDGSVIVSSMNWGSHPTAVTDHQFHPGPGVAFVIQ